MIAFSSFNLTKDALEETIGYELTDSQWEYIVLELEGRVVNYIDEVLENVIQDMDELEIE
jgi:hypothetical protein